MTVTLSIEAPSAPNPAAILERIASPHLRGAGAIEGAHSWPLGLALFYLHERSARGVPIRYDGQRFAVRLMALSTADEIELGLALITRAAEILERPIVTLDGPAPSGLADLERELLTSGAVEAADLVRERGTIAIAGPVRAYHFGPRTLRSLEEARPAGDLGVRLREAIRRLQFVDETKYFASGVVEIATQQGARVEIAVWAPGIDYLFPPIDFIRIATPDPEELLLVSPTELADLAGKRLVYLDERHALMRAIAATDWPDLLVRARRLQSKLPL